MKKYKTEQERLEARRESKRRSRLKAKLAKQQLNSQMGSAPVKVVQATKTVQGLIGALTSNAPAPKKQITYIAIVTDHSSSMYGLTTAARKDFNSILSSIKQHQNDVLENHITHIACGDRRGYNGVYVMHRNVAADRFMEMTNYTATYGSTPLLDSINAAIVELNLAQANNPDAAFLVQVVTDGGENSSRISQQHVVQKINQLLATDRWTFTFRVPRGHKQYFTRMGISPDNVLEWDTTVKGMEQSNVTTVAATQSYFTERARGVTNTTRFYADLSGVSGQTVDKNCVDISADVSIWPVSPSEHGMQIRDFVERRTKKPFIKGTAFYQLNKTEKNVQNYKKIVIRNKTTKAVYGGDSARALLKLPFDRNVTLVPGNHGDFDIFIQSTSVNRKIHRNTEVLYWNSAV